MGTYRYILPPERVVIPSTPLGRARNQHIITDTAKQGTSSSSLALPDHETSASSLRLVPGEDLREGTLVGLHADLSDAVEQLDAGDVLWEASEELSEVDEVQMEQDVFVQPEYAYSQSINQSVSPTINQLNQSFSESMTQSINHSIKQLSLLTNHLNIQHSQSIIIQSTNLISQSINQT